MPLPRKSAALRATDTVYDAFDAPLPGVHVQALHKNICAEESLGTTQTVVKGSYTIALQRPRG